MKHHVNISYLENIQLMGTLESLCTTSTIISIYNYGDFYILLL